MKSTKLPSLSWNILMVSSMLEIFLLLAISRFSCDLMFRRACSFFLASRLSWISLIPAKLVAIWSCMGKGDKKLSQIGQFF